MLDSASPPRLELVEYLLSFASAPDLIARVRRFELREALSEPFLLKLELICEPGSVELDQLLGSDCELIIDRRSTTTRTVLGLVTACEHAGTVAEGIRLRVVIEPALSLLEQRTDTRSWQQLSAVDVAREVLSQGLARYGRELDASHLERSYAPREFIVQYRESDLAFARRLLEDEGVAFHLQADPASGCERMVLEDDIGHWPEVLTIDDDPALPIIVDRPEEAELESLQSLCRRRALTSTTVARRSFDWLEPLEPKPSQAPAHAASDERGVVRERYDHDRICEDDPEPRTARQLAHAQRSAERLCGTSNVIGLTPGCRFRVRDDDDDTDDSEYLVTRVAHVGDCPDAELHASVGTGSYHNEFEACRFEGSPWLPPRTTPHPTIAGPQTAIVTGPEGAEIHTDEHGRVKVRFHWDRLHTLTDDTSRWVRVAQRWAGAGFGSLFIPRVGMEVVVEFVEGNPDHPVVTGCMYNGDNRASVALPDDKTQSTIRTQSSPGGGGFNELRFEDAAGSEEVFLHAQRDFVAKTKRNHSSTVGGSQRLTVGGDRTQRVRGDETRTVEGNHKHTVEGDEAHTVVGERRLTVSGWDHYEVHDQTVHRHCNSRMQTVLGRDELYIQPDSNGTACLSTQVGQDATLRVERKARARIGESLTLEQGLPAAQTSTTLEAGSWTTTAHHDVAVQAGETLCLRGDQVARLAQDGASIVIEGNTVTIQAEEIRLVANGTELLLGADALQAKTPAVDVSALGAITFAGAVVNLD